MDSNLNDKFHVSDVSDIIESLIDQYKDFFAQKYERATDKVSAGDSLLSYAKLIPIIRTMFVTNDDKQKVINKLLEQQRLATSYNKWRQVSLKLDELLDNDSFKLNPESDIYDYDLIYNNMMEMRSARESKDYKLLLYLIRTKWIRNVGNICHVDLYRHSFVGTKRLIEEYIEECNACLVYLVNDTGVNLNDKYLLGMLIQTRKNIGRTAIVLSGGSTFGMFQIGVLVSLLELNLLPRIVSGSSAGSIVASILCCHNNDENRHLIQTLSDKKFTIFSSNNGDDDDGDESKGKLRSLLKSLSHLLKYGTLFDNDGLKETMRGFVGDLTFREAYNRTGKILNITVSPAALHEQTRLLNYLTAPNCLIWSAVCASCSLPGFFPSSSIYEKDPRTLKIQKWNNNSSLKFLDGSVDNDLPITRLLEMFNVDNIIAVQVNPHVVPILKASVSNPGSVIENEFTNRLNTILNNIYDFCTSEVIHYLQVLNEMDIYKNLSTKLVSVLSQKYSGDITILPDFELQDFGRVFMNPTPEFIADFIIRGARATWPKSSMIHNNCAVEFELDKAITILRGRSIATSDSKSGLNNSAVNNIKSVVSNESYNSNLSSFGNQDEEGEEDDDGGDIKESEEDYFTLSDAKYRSYPVTPEKRRIPSIFKNIPKIRRNNTLNSGSLPTKSSFTGKKQRNSIGAFQGNNSYNQNDAPDLNNGKSHKKGKSTTSLSGLDFSTPEKNNDDLPRSAHSANGNGTRRRISFEVDKQNLRKAKSSGNFYKLKEQEISQESPIEQKLKYESQRVPFLTGNPYVDGNQKNDNNEVNNGDYEDYNDGIYDYDGYDNYVADNDNEEYKVYRDDEFILEGDQSEHQQNISGHDSPLFNSSESKDRENANLPKRSHANSLSNSHIGLNRLKDANLLKSSTNSSSNSLQGYNNHLLTLNSPDIRRALKKNKRDPRISFDIKDEDKSNQDIEDTDGDGDADEGEGEGEEEEVGGSEDDDTEKEKERASQNNDNYNETETEVDTEKDDNYGDEDQK